MQCAARENVNVMKQRPSSACRTSVDHDRPSPDGTEPVPSSVSPLSPSPTRRERACVWAITAFAQRRCPVDAEDRSVHGADEVRRRGLRFDVTFDNDEVTSSDGSREASLHWRLLSHLLSHTVPNVVAGRGRMQNTLLSPTLPHTIRFLTCAMPTSWACQLPAVTTTVTDAVSEEAAQQSQEQQRARLAELLCWLPPLQHHIQDRLQKRSERRQRQKKRPAAHATQPAPPSPTRGTDDRDEANEAAWMEAKCAEALAHALANLSNLLAPLSTSTAPLSIAVTAATVAPIEPAVCATSSKSTAFASSVPTSAARDASYLHIRCSLLENTDDEEDGREVAPEGSVGEVEGAAEAMLADVWAAQVNTWLPQQPGARPRSYSTGSLDRPPETILCARLRTRVEAVEAQLPLFAGTVVKVHRSPRVSLEELVSTPLSASPPPSPASRTSPRSPPRSSGRSLRLRTLHAVVRQEAPGLAPLQTYIATCLALIAELTDFQAQYTAPAGTRSTLPYLESELAYLTELFTFYAMATPAQSAAAQEEDKEDEEAYGAVNRPGRDPAATHAHVALWLRTHLLGASGRGSSAASAFMPSLPASLAPLYAALFAGPAYLSLHTLVANWRHWLVLHVVSAATDWTSLWMSASVRVLVPRCPSTSATALSSPVAYRLVDVCHEQFRFYTSGAGPAKSTTVSVVAAKDEASPSLAALSARGWCRQLDLDASELSLSSLSLASVSESGPGAGGSGGSGGSGDDGDDDDDGLMSSGAAELGSLLWEGIAARFPDMSRASRVLLHVFEFFHARVQRSSTLRPVDITTCAAAVSRSCAAAGMSLHDGGPVWYAAMRRAVLAPEESAVFARSAHALTVVFHAADEATPRPAATTTTTTTTKRGAGQASADTALACALRGQGALALETSFEELSCEVSPTPSGSASPTSPLSGLLASAFRPEGSAADDTMAPSEPELPVLCRWRYRDFLKVFGSVWVYHTHYAHHHHSADAAETDSQRGSHWASGEDEVDSDHNSSSSSNSSSEASADLAKSVLDPAERLQLPLVRCLTLCSAAHVPFLVCPTPITAAFVGEALETPSVLFAVAQGEVLVQHVCVLAGLLAATARATALLRRRGVVALQSFLRATGSRRWHTGPLRRVHGVASVTRVQSFLRARASAQEVDTRRAVLAAEASRASHEAREAEAREAGAREAGAREAGRADTRAASPLYAEAAPSVPLFAWSRHARPSTSPPRTAPLPLVPAAAAAPATATTPPAQPLISSFKRSPPVAVVPPSPRLAPVLATLQTLESEGRYWILQEVQLVWQELLIGWERLQRVRTCQEEAAEAEAFSRACVAIWQAAHDNAATRKSADVPALDASLTVSVRVSPKNSPGKDVDEEVPEDEEADVATPELLRNAVHVARFGAGRVAERRPSASLREAPTTLVPSSSSSPSSSAELADAQAALLLQERADRAELCRRHDDLVCLLTFHYVPILQQTAVLRAEDASRARLTAVEALERDEVQRRWCVVVLPCAIDRELLQDKSRAAWQALSLPRQPTRASTPDSTATSPSAGARRPRQRQRGVTLFERPSDLPPPVRSADIARDGAAGEGENGVRRSPPVWGGAVLRATDFALSTPGPSIMAPSHPLVAGPLPSHPLVPFTADNNAAARPTRAGSVPLEDHGVSNVAQAGCPSCIEAPSRSYAASPPPTRGVPVVNVSLRDSACASSVPVRQAAVATQAQTPAQAPVHKLMPRRSRHATTTAAATAATARSEGEGDRATAESAAEAAHTRSPDPPPPLPYTFPENVGSDEYQRLKTALEGSPDGPRTHYRSARAIVAQTPAPAPFLSEGPTAAHPVRRRHVTTPPLDREISEMARFIHGEGDRHSPTTTTTARAPVIVARSRPTGMATRVTVPDMVPADVDGSPLAVAAAATPVYSGGLVPQRQPERRMPSHDWSCVPRRRQGRVSVVTWADSVMDTN